VLIVVGGVQVRLGRCVLPLPVWGLLPEHVALWVAVLPMIVAPPGLLPCTTTSLPARLALTVTAPVLELTTTSCATWFALTVMRPGFPLTATS
jgi:hypothetical protein